MALYLKLIFLSFLSLQSQHLQQRQLILKDQQPWLLRHLMSVEEEEEREEKAGQLKKQLRYSVKLVSCLSIQKF